MYIDGEQVESGTWAGDNPQDPVRSGEIKMEIRKGSNILLSGGVFVIGQDQDEIRGGYNPRQSWSGAITQVGAQT